MPDAPLRAAPDAALPEGSEFSGLVALSRPARIDGTVRGDVLAADLLWIGERGRVEGRVEAEELVVAGQLDGEVRATRRIELLPTARVSASLAAPKLALAEGSYLEGRCRCGPGAGPGDAPERSASP
jgi:cytoskeletal protein CcmA (bactofilin family)